MKYAHTNIITADWQRLSQFYIDVFDCRFLPPKRTQQGDWLSKGTGIPNAHLQGVHLLLPGYGENGPTLEIYQYTELADELPSIGNRLGFRHIAFEVEDVATTLDAILTHGGESVGEIIERSIPEKGSLTFTYAKDPDGNLLEIQKWS